MSKQLYLRKYMGTMSLQEFEDAGESLVYKMMLDYLGKEEEYRRRLKLYAEEKTEEEVQRKVLQDMWQEIDEAQKGAPYER